MFFSLRGFVNRLTGPIRTFFSPITRYLSIPTRFIGAPGRLLGLSLPARVGLILFVFLVVLVVATPFALASLDRSAALDEFKQPRWLIVLTVMVVLTPIVAYQTVKVFLEGVDSEYPEIDRAWDAGLTALVKSGLDLTKLPVFLVLGPRSPAQIDNIVDACGLQLLVDRVPEGRAPLRWYASEQAVMLACIETGCLSLTNASLRTSTPALDAGPTDEVDLGGTLKVGLSEATDAVHDPSPLESEFAEQSGVFGTLVAGLKDTLRPGTSVLAKDVFAGSRLSNADTELETRRLMHVANLLRRARQPYCAANGILVLIPWETIHKDTLLATKELPAALNRDLESFTAITQLNCPITAFVTGMESETGFSELVRRVGSRHCQRRFGQSFDVSNATSRKNMETLAAHARGAYEDWVYQLFREPDGLAKPGNFQLYGLLCKIRSRLAERLRNVLINGFGRQPGENRLLLSGLYFAATGATADQRCFVRGVIGKMLDLDEEVEWSDQAWGSNRRFLWLAQLGMLFNVLLAAAIIALFFLPRGR